MTRLILHRGRRLLSDHRGPRAALTAQHYFKSPQENGDPVAAWPEAIDNTVEIARRCASKSLSNVIDLPKFCR